MCNIMFLKTDYLKNLYVWIATHRLGNSAGVNHMCRAVRLEMAYSLTTDSFLNVLYRIGNHFESNK